MFKLFKRNKDHLNELRGNLSEKVHKKLLQVERRCVEFLKRKTDHWSAKQWKIALVVFCLVFGAAGVNAFVEAFKERPASKISPAFVQKKIEAPPISTQKRQGAIAAEDINEKDFQQLLLIDQFLDSLNKTDSGRKIYDSIISRNPGLKDSVRLLEQQYREKKK